MIPKKLLQAKPPEKRWQRPRFSFGFVDHRSFFILAFNLGKIFEYPKVDKVLYQIPQLEFYWKIWRARPTTDREEKILGIPPAKAGFFQEKPVFKINRFDPVYHEMLKGMADKATVVLVKRQMFAKYIITEYLHGGRHAVRAARLKKARRAERAGSRPARRHVGEISDLSYFQGYSEATPDKLRVYFKKVCVLCFRRVEISYWLIAGPGVNCPLHNCSENSLIDEPEFWGRVRATREAKIKEQGFWAYFLDAKKVVAIDEAAAVTEEAWKGLDAREVNLKQGECFE